MRQIFATAKSIWMLGDAIHRVVCKHCGLFDNLGILLFIILAGVYLPLDFNAVIMKRTVQPIEETVQTPPRPELFLYLDPVPLFNGLRS